MSFGGIVFAEAGACVVFLFITLEVERLELTLVGLEVLDVLADFSPIISVTFAPGPEGEVGP